MKQLLYTLAGIALVTIVCRKHKEYTILNEPTGLNEEPTVTAEDIKRGVKAGWYDAKLIDAEDIKRVELRGKNTLGEETVAVRIISPADMEELRASLNLPVVTQLT